MDSNVPPLSEGTIAHGEAAASEVRLVPAMSASPVRQAEVG